jgi:ankyrin repeat protein
MSSIRIPDSQHWLIKRMQKLGYASDKNGICFGISHMAMQAIHAGPEALAIFNKRLLLIASIPEEKFKEEVDAIRKKQSDLSTRARTIAESKVRPKPSTKPFSEMTDEEKNENEIWQKDLYSELKKQFKILAKKEQIEPMALEIILEIPAFLEGVELYHQALKYPELFPPMEEKSQADSKEEKKPSTVPTKQNAMLTMPLVESKALEGLHIGIVPGGDFSGAYDLSDLTIYFKTLANALHENQFNLPISLILSSGNHTITVSYDPGTKKWLFINAGQLSLSTQPINNPEGIARAVLGAFSKNNVACFSTQLYAPASQHDKLKKVLERCNDQQPWKDVHAVNQTKAALSDSNNVSWLSIAARNGHTDTVKTLIDSKAEIDKPDDKKGITPLYVAASNGHTDVVDVLIKAGANVNKPTHKGLTPLYVAVRKGHLKIAQALLKEGAISTLKDLLKILKASNNELKAAVYENLQSQWATLITTKKDLDTLSNFYDSEHITQIANLLLINAIDNATKKEEQQSLWWIGWTTMWNQAINLRQPPLEAILMLRDSLNHGTPLDAKYIEPLSHGKPKEMIENHLKIFRPNINIEQFLAMAVRGSPTKPSPKF